VSDARLPRGTPGADATLRRLWGQEAERRRGPKPALSVEAILDVAYRIAETEGLAAVSMVRVAEALGCTSMALYRHIASKDELLVLLTDRVAADLPVLPDAETWRDGLARWAQAQFEAAVAHPWMLGLPLTTTPLGPHRARWIDQGFGAMRDLDLPAADKRQIIAMLTQYVLGEALVLAELQRADADPYADLALIFTELADAADLPHLFADLPEGFESADGSPDQDAATFGIQLILDGVEAHLRRQNPGRSRPRTTP
jgi:AcrR family transcriptional regulator